MARIISVTSASKRKTRIELNNGGLQSFANGKPIRFRDVGAAKAYAKQHGITIDAE